MLHRTNTRFPDGMPLAREALMNEGLVVLYRLRRRAQSPITESLQTSLREWPRIALMPAFGPGGVFHNLATHAPAASPARPFPQQI